MNKKDSNGNGKARDITGKNGNYELVNTPEIPLGKKERKQRGSIKSRETEDDSPFYETNVLEQLTGQINNQQLLQVLTAVRNGDFSVRMPIDQVGLSGKVCD